MSQTNKELLEATGKVLLRCGLFGFSVLLFWAGAFLFAGDLTGLLGADQCGATATE